MTHRISTLPASTVGLDIGDRKSVFCQLDEAGDVVAGGTMRTTATALNQLFGALPRSRVALEATTHSPWISRLLAALGHEVLVAHPVASARLADRLRKSDQRDAECLARTARLDPRLLSPLVHRPERQQHDLAVIRMRQALVSSRTRLVHTVRGTVKAAGGRVVGLTSSSFGRKALSMIPEDLRPALVPLLETIKTLSHQITEHDRRIELLAQQSYPAIARLTQVHGVGTLTALAFVLTLGDPCRFRSRSVAAYLGLVPRRRQSGESDPQLPITKAGDPLMRRLLVQCAHYMLGPFGRDSDLRRYGMTIIERGGRGARQRAAVAVARRLATLLHSLWRTGEVYQPLRNSPLGSSQSDAA